MNAVTDAVRREYDALYLNRKSLREAARSSLHRVGGVPVADVLDEAFLTLWRDLTDGRVDGPLDELIHKHINQAGWKLARRVLRIGKHEQQYGLVVGEELELLGYKAQTPERTRFADTFDDAVRSLTPKQREAYILTELRGLTQREAADVLGVSQPTVHDRVVSATEALRTALIEGDAL